ncbi:hypothetical protein XENORESO_005064 [Xenotaenia resolanae]|uniref:Secreted protein n=1 Tax=Xenotaenia resolanae TaxID=208358 RepID=A0ABV0WK76_9TELE
MVLLLLICVNPVLFIVHHKPGGQPVYFKHPYNIKRLVPSQKSFPFKSQCLPRDNCCIFCNVLAKHMAYKTQNSLIVQCFHCNAGGVYHVMFAANRYGAGESHLAWPSFQ